MKIRIKFAKYGSMKFIGHLDVMRFFQKAIRRAGIDIHYSEGFNPHQIMSFAAPLGVGLESTGEYLDIEVSAVSSTQDIKDALNQTMAEGLKILAVTLLPDNAKNAMASVAAARYRIVCHIGPDEACAPDVSGSLSQLPDKLSAFYNREHILVTKTTKKSVLEIDLKPGIYELTMTQESEDSFTITMLVNASSSGNIKPVMVLDAFLADAQITLPPYAYQITRIDTYTNTAKENETPVFVPLSHAGAAQAAGKGGI